MDEGIRSEDPSLTAPVSRCRDECQKTIAAFEKGGETKKAFSRCPRGLWTDLQSRAVMQALSPLLNHHTQNHGHIQTHLFGNLHA